MKIKNVENTAVFDSNLSLKSLGLLMTAISLNLNDFQSLLDTCPEGKTSLYSALNELIEVGYCLSQDKRDSNNKFIGTEYLFSLNPIYLNQSSKDHLYLIAFDNSSLKIGRSTNPKKRLKTLEFQINSKGTIIKVLKNKGAIEKRVHIMFSKYKITGEWFKDVPEIREFFKNFK